MPVTQDLLEELQEKWELALPIVHGGLGPVKPGDVTESARACSHYSS